MIYQVCNTNGLTPGAPARVEGDSPEAALDNWARNQGFQNYAEARSHGHAKTAFESHEPPQGRMKAWRTTHEVWIRRAVGGPIGNYGQPNEWGPQSQCRDFAKKAGAEMNLPIIEWPEDRKS